MPQGVRSVTDDELVEWIRSLDDPAYTTTEIADGVGMGVEGTRNRLTDLADDGVINCKIAGRSAVWWVDADEGQSLPVDDA